MANIITQLLGNAVELANTFANIVLGTDPVSAVLSTVLLVSGAIFVLFSVGVFGYLATGAIVSAVIPANIGRTPPQQGE